MMWRLVALVTLVLLASCGGGSSPTASDTPGPTADDSSNELLDTGGPQCAGSDVKARLTSHNVYSLVHYFTFYFSSANECAVSGPPSIEWYDSDGNELHLGQPGPATEVCDDGTKDFSMCVHDGPLVLPGDQFFGSIPQGFFLDVAAIVAVDDTSLRKCIDRSRQAAVEIGFLFEGADEARVKLEPPVSMACSPAARLAGYGPFVNTLAYAPACDIDQLAGSWVFTGVALGTNYHEFGISNVGSEDCAVEGPPSLYLEDAAGQGLNVAYETNPPCSNEGNSRIPGDPDFVNETNCIKEGKLLVVARGPLPTAGTRYSGQLTLTVAAGNAAYFDPPCESTHMASLVGVRFPGSPGELRLQFPQPVDLQTCYPQVVLHRFN